MRVCDNAFERRWLGVFMVLYVVIMIPFPWYFDTEYAPGPWGVPLFIFGWLAHGIVVLLAIAVFARQSLQRPEYRDPEQKPE